jgi:tetratricopeptide (TPR) repeat protein
LLIEDMLHRLDQKGQRYSTLWFQVKRQLVRAWTKLRLPKNATDAARETLQELKQQGIPAATTITVKSACLDAFKEAGDYAMAEALIQECMQLCQHEPRVGTQREWVEDRYIWLIRAKGDHRRGVDWLAEKIAGLKKSGDVEPTTIIKLLMEQARFEFDAGLRTESIQHAGEACSIAREISPVETPTQGLQTAREHLVDTLCDLAEYESRDGRHEDAIRHACEAFQVADEQGHINRLEDSLLVLAQAHERAGDLDSAFESYRLRYERVGQRGANYLRWHEDLQFMCVTRLKQNRADDAMTLAHELWKKENSSKEARQDKAHLADIARLALRCHDALKKCRPDTAEPAEYPAWKAAATPAR